jgi:hypothetical protein
VVAAVAQHPCFSGQANPAELHIRFRPYPSAACVFAAALPLPLQSLKINMGHGITSGLVNTKVYVLTLLLPVCAAVAEDQRGHA